ncbi:hypothetical protein tb265_18590 [Gemmatimonadetes bacterium T265]|nr:hypothetical protein tb265_18590 [Gemmatimonadetes bacterium T265]
MLRRLARAASAAALTLLAAAPLAAQAVRIDFAEYASDTTREYAATVGQPLTSKGFDFYEAFGSSTRNVLGTWGTADAGAVNRPSNGGTSTGLYATVPGAEIDMYVAGDDPFVPVRTFNLYSIDVAHLFSTPYAPFLQPFDLTFFGILASGGFVYQTFTIPAPPLIGGQQTPVYHTLTFDADFRGLDDVFWDQDYSYVSVEHQFTNVVAEVTPEPSTYALLGVGLAGVLVVARRRREA